MRYGVLIKDFHGFFGDRDVRRSGTAFSFSCTSSNGAAEHHDLYAEKWSSVQEEFYAIISEEEYNRLTQKKNKNIHPKLLKAFEAGDWGCQEKSVKNILEAITELMEVGE